MSDVLDVEVALVQAAASAVYPKLRWDTPGVTWDSPQTWDSKAGPSITGTDIVVYPGWPDQDGLSADMAKGKTHITVFPKPEERNTTRYEDVDWVTACPALALGLNIADSVVTVGKYDPAGSYDAGGARWDSGGSYDNYSNPALTISTPQNVALRINGKFYVYAAQAGNTLATVATALANLVAVDIAGTYPSGSDIVVGPTGRIQAARVGGFGTVGKEVRRQERVMMITVWANAPALRDQIAAAVDVALAQTKFLRMPDGFGARLIYKNSTVIDATQKANLYRRDLNYMVEYATTVSVQRAAVIAPSADIKSNYNSFVITS